MNKNILNEEKGKIQPQAVSEPAAPEQGQDVPPPHVWETQRKAGKGDAGGVTQAEASADGMSAADDTLPTEVKPLGGAALPASSYSWRRVEQEGYWNRILTADPDTIPLDIQTAVSADETSSLDENREYRLLRTVNRSWAADHLGMTREKIKSDWPEIRARLAEKLGVAGNEQEVFTELSLRAQEAPRRRRARSAYEAEYLRVLTGERAQPSPEAEDKALPQGERACLDEIRTMARAAAENDRERSLQHAEALQHIVRTFSQMERGPLEQMRALWHSPQFLDAVDELAEMEENERAVLYRVAQAEWKRNGHHPQPESLPVAMLHNMVRGGVNLGFNIGQAAGNVAVAQLRQLGESFGVDRLNEFSAKQDKRLRVLEELRRVVQQEVLPIRLDEDATFAEELMVDVAGGVPGVALAFAGVPGISLLAASSAGDSVASARQRAPEADQKLQTAAGCLAGAAQAAIFKGMTGLGQRLMSRCINQFAGSMGQGGRRYVLSALKSGSWFTQETVNMLLAGKAAQVAEMGLQELAARADDAASNIDWKSYGDNVLDLETNIREAAMNLPFVLIAGGKAALHHFRSPRGVLGDGHQLDEWGVAPAMKERVMQAQDLQQQGELLREALRSSRRWSGAGFLSDVAAKSLRLLQTKDLQLFDNERVVAQFLAHPGEKSVLNDILQGRQDGTLPGEAPPESLPPHAHTVPGKRLPAEKMQWLSSLMNGWLKKAGMHPEKENGGAGKKPAAGAESRLVPELRQRGNHLPQAERVRRGILAEWVQSVEQLSHRFLLNTYTIDTLHRSFASEQVAIRNTEKQRKQIRALVARAVLQSVVDGHQVAANADIKNHFRNFYLSRRYNSIREPWLQKTTSAQVRSMVELASGTAHISKRLPEETRELRRQYLGLTAAVRGLTELIPHMEDFHTMLSLGHSPLGAYAAILAREFELPENSPDWKPAGWDVPAAETASAEAQANTERNMQKLELYSLLTGRAPEMERGHSGCELWRIRRPDGTYTRWHERAQQAANDMAYVYALRLGMPYEKELYAERLQENMRLNGYEFARLLPQQRRRYCTHDALGYIALNDLHELWLGSAADKPLGLEYQPGELPGLMARHHYDGVAPFLASWPGSEPNRHFLLDARRTVNPLNLIFARARVYWQRMLDSGAISPQEVTDFLVQQGEISPERKQKLLHMPEVNHRLYLLPEVKKMTRRRRHRYVRQLRELLRSRDSADMRTELALDLSYFSTKCLVAGMEQLRLPDSVKEWIAAAPFRAPDERTAVDRPGLIGRGRHKPDNPRNSEEFLIRWMNDKSAGYLLENAERIAALRPLLADESSPLRRSPLYERLREVWTPSEAQRKEQCWSYLLSGDKHFRHAGQELWNLLRTPDSAWKRLPEQQQELLREDLMPIIRQHPSPGVNPHAADALEQSLLHLQALLEEKPTLRDFSLNLRQPGQVLRLQLAPPLPPRISERQAAVAQKAAFRGDTPDLQPGGTMQVSSLPQEWQADSRILPALHLLTALRHQVMDYPLVTPQGIRWRNQPYGGTDGLRPRGLTDDWRAEKPLAGLLEAIQSLESVMDGKNTEWVGEMLQPMPSPPDLSPLRHVTIYRNEKYPAVQVRLMPGDFATAALSRRKPYVVHSLAGAPLPGRSGWKINQDIASVYHDMVRFNGNLEQLHYDERSHKAGGFFAMVFNQLQTRLMDAHTLRLGRDAELSNREIIMHLAQDTGYSDKLSGADISRFTPDEVVTLSLFRLLMAYEYSPNPEAAEAALLKLGARFREDENLFEQVKENILDSSADGLELIEATQLADEHLIRRDDGTVLQQSYHPKRSRRYKKTEPRYRSFRVIDDDARAREYMRNPQLRSKSRNDDGSR